MLAFVAVLLFVMGISAVLQGQRPDEKEDADKPGLFRTFAREIQALGQTVEPAMARAFPVQTSQLQNELVAAALYEHVSLREVRGLQCFLALILGIAAGLLFLLVTMNGVGTAFALILFGTLGFMYPTMWVARKARERKESIGKALPYAIDLLTVAMQAGQDFGAAVRHLVTEGPHGPLFQEFAIMLQETELGKSRVEAMRVMSDRIQVDEFRAVVTAVIQSTEMGASVTSALKMQAEELRRSRFHKAERKAARAPSIMMIPVAIFILPAVFIVILTPVALRVMNVMQATR
jgi:tight adherence protein C